jgi:hypothetical protein
VVFDGRSSLGRNGLELRHGGLIDGMYPCTAMSATDPNQDVARMIKEGGGRIFLDWLL